jgi:hypothetical protein
MAEFKNPILQALYEEAKRGVERCPYPDCGVKVMEEPPQDMTYIVDTMERHVAELHPERLAMFVRDCTEWGLK